MHYPIPVFPVRTTQVDNVTVQDVPMLFVPGDYLLDSLLGPFCVVQPETPVTRLHSGTIVLDHVGLVSVKMLVKWLQRGSSSTAVILDQRGECPTVSGVPLPCSVEDVLAPQDDLPVSRERPVVLPVTDSAFARSDQHCPHVRDIHVYSLGPHPLVKILQHLSLVPLGIFQPFMEGMGSRGARIPGVRAIVLEHIHSGLLKEGLDLPEILVSPFARKTW